jgi:hypothetical protein
MHLSCGRKNNNPDRKVPFGENNSSTGNLANISEKI